ncbi:MAG: 50S ribosomal protein L25/general stress protein Ctc [Pseudomonadota bacterium]|nr:50S ribosomal protein L25/general stress protein Ctc [Pseudomonadota bacterium]
MSSDYVLVAEPRNDLGKGASRRLRRECKVPAIIYGGAKDPQALSLDHNALIHSLENEAFYSHVLNIKIGDTDESALLKDLQRHPARPMILHVDLLRVSADQEVRVNVPLHFVNEDSSVGVKQEGGAVSHLLTDVEVSCLPKDLPEFIEVDLAQVHLNGSLHLSDLTPPKGVKLVELGHGEGHDHAVVTIHATRVSGSEDHEAAEEGGEGGELGE